MLVKNPISLISNTRLSIGSTVEDFKEYVNAIQFGWTVTINSSDIISRRGSDKDTHNLSVIVEITIQTGADNLGKVLVMPQ